MAGGQLLNALAHSGADTITHPRALIVTLSMYAAIGAARRQAFALAPRRDV